MAPAAASTPTESELPVWFQLLLYRLTRSLPSRPPAAVTSRWDALLTVGLLLALLYMTLGALLRHVSTGVDADRARRRVHPVRAAFRWYAAVTHVAALLMFVLDAGRYMLAAVGASAVGRTAAPPRLVAFWTITFLALYADVALSALAVVRPIARGIALATTGKRARGFCGALTEAVGELDALELVFTRVALLGACYVLAAYGK
jgi:hypothetical protein